jgi:hypothetical protein
VTESNLPVEAGARLPATYEAAKKALAECTKIDECRDWADKAAAMASYARQASDHGLLNLAQRIQARATRRYGELLKQVERAPGARTDLGRAPTRGSAAAAAGLSEHQAKQGLRVASIPEAEFERAVASESPPTITELAAQGTARRTNQSAADGSKTTAQSCKQLLQFADFCAASDPGSIAQNLDRSQVAAVRQCVDLVDRWLDQLMASLGA